MKLTKIEHKVLSHWADNLTNAILFYRTRKKEYLDLVEIGTRSCEFCKIYYVSTVENQCLGCPVIKDGHRYNCTNTPWVLVNYFKEKMSEDIDYLEFCQSSDIMLKEFVSVVFREYLFLKTVFKGIKE